MLRRPQQVPAVNPLYDVRVRRNLLGIAHLFFTQTQALLLRGQAGRQSTTTIIKGTARCS